MKDCNQCGKCCTKYSDGGLCATQAEIDDWAEHHPKIYQYVHNGNIWFDPVAKTQLTLCPFLETQRDGKYTCSIYLERPDDCRHYPVTIDQMIIDDCEMIEQQDLFDREKSQTKLDLIMIDSRPPYGG